MSVSKCPVILTSEKDKNGCRKLGGDFWTQGNYFILTQLL